MTEIDPSPLPSNSAPAETASDAPGAEPPSTSTLTPRQERFCRYYLTEPSATRAAIKAGYSEQGAGQAAHRMLKNVEILQRIDAVRRSENLIYDLSPQAVMDRCEALFEEALEKGRYEAAIGALRLQARIGGLLGNDRKAATAQDLAGAIDYSVRAAVSKYVAFGTLGSVNPMAPPPWAPGEEAARRTRRKIDSELADWPPERRERPGERQPAEHQRGKRKPHNGKTDAIDSEPRLNWPGDEASLLRAAVGHEDAFQAAAGQEPATPVFAKWAPGEIRAETERAYAIGRSPEPDEPPPERGFPAEDT